MKINNYYLGQISFVFMLCFFCIVTVSFFILTSSSVLADDTDTSVVTTTTISVPESCSMSGTTNTAHSATILNGTYSGTDYTNGIGQTTLKVFCNDSNGFAIYAIGYTNDEYGNNTLHWSGASSTSDTTNDINTGIYSSGATTSSWSMKLSAMSGTYTATIADGTGDDTEDFTDWHTVPSDHVRVAYRTSGTDLNTNNNGTGSSITTTYDAYVSPTQPAGTYTGQVKYTLVHPSSAAKPVRPLRTGECPNSSICYVPNADDIKGDMSSLGTVTSLSNVSTIAGKVAATANSTITLIAPNFKREGYGFAGWSTDYVATDDSVIYGPNETISTNPSDTDGVDVSSGLALYPVWVASNGNLQSWNGCGGLTIAPTDDRATLSSVTALTDTRDGNVYTVAKLADGNCWMVENLRLNAENTRSVADIAKAQGYGQSETYGNFIGLADSEDTNFTGSTLPSLPGVTDNKANSLYSSTDNTEVNIGTGSNKDFRMPRYNNNNTNIGGKNSAGTNLVVSHITNTNAVQWYSYGNYYTWAAAMASTKYYTSYYNANETEAQNSDAAGTSICPFGWRLPFGYTSNGTLDDGASDSANRVGSFSYLDRKMGGTGATQSSDEGLAQSKKWRSFPNNIVYSGTWSGSSASNRGTSGRYWSSSASSSSNAYYLSIGSDVMPGSGNVYKYNGYSIRCIKNS